MSQKQALEYLQQYKEAHVPELADELDKHQKSVYQNLKALFKVGWVEQEKDSIPHTYKITERGMQAEPSSLEKMVV